MPDIELDENDLQDFIDEDLVEPFCYQCNSDHNNNELLICDKCNIKICHVSCDEAILDGRVPEGDW